MKIIFLSSDLVNYLTPFHKHWGSATGVHVGIQNELGDAIHYDVQLGTHAPAQSPLHRDTNDPRTGTARESCW